jgi:hypothetical protein
MSEQQEPQVEGFGEFHPLAASYSGYNDAMAAWHNEVKNLQGPPSADASPEAEEEAPAAAQDDAESEQRQAEPQEPEQGPQEPQEASEPREEEQDSGTDEPREVYDPSAHTALEVMNYLKGVGEAEAERVLDSEAAGKNRKGITGLREDFLAQARNNDQTGSGSTEA